MTQTNHVNAISLDHGDVLTDQSHEIVRVWVTNGAGSHVWISARMLEDPTIFGYLMSDTIRHAARAYATTWGVDEAQALQSIVAGLSAELRNQVGEITTIQEGSLN
ncbi:DUF5076 domain-containing protein [Sphingobium sp. AR-3-1]|uniref:DUF5076 domain-containing protein n=1 Tax=Sphingobium psychrophilum TaxID=2728834 RepID=A0A7X9WS22_9SPHN|nr:DUF5076 domain-containing protein [Sphingobium psychrophilum]NML08865.1 DUF5076 domain-containing protein [Sphingobium psychrophilum]